MLGVIVFLLLVIIYIVYNKKPIVIINQPELEPTRVRNRRCAILLPVMRNNTEASPVEATRF